MMDQVIKKYFNTIINYIIKWKSYIKYLIFWIWFFLGSIPQLHISYKPQKISPKSQGIVRQLLHEKIRDAYVHPQFVTDVMKPLKIDDIMDQEVQNLSGGELQRVALALCLGKPADVYLIDEPSAYLDSEQRLVAAKVIKR